ncbi:golgin-45-like [Acanthaster planci]|uniref:Golgin-45-like n=1 Tax=Acanthaster planci TaxID=133434 RepID=A0A8B7YKB7_ACAPL|nr:golgin-45-like [Acanthaster planci]
MDQRNLDNIIFTHGQSINRDGTLPAFPRLEGDGKENAFSSSEPAGIPTAMPRLARPAFFDGKSRNSTDVALAERNRQRDIGPQSPGPLGSGCSVFGSGQRDVCAQLEEAIKEKEKLKKQLSRVETEVRELREDQTAMVSEAAVQNQVNKDLKKLLVASMGADLQAQLEHLSTERAQLAQDLENTIATLAEERETLERVNIQCDVWRSKFLGSRLQVDEAVSSRTRLNMVLQEACFALGKILEERDEIRTHMMQTQRLLHYLSNALQRTHSLSEDIKPSSNVLTLALLNEQVATIVSKHLLGDVGHSQDKTASQFDFVEWTSAEMLAKDILLNRQPALKLEQLHTFPSSASTTLMPPSSSSPPSATAAAATGLVTKTNMAHRFHPQTKYENLTINCCKYCTGDIKLV